MDVSRSDVFKILKANPLELTKAVHLSLAFG